MEHFIQWRAGCLLTKIHPPASPVPFHLYSVNAVACFYSTMFSVVCFVTRPLFTKPQACKKLARANHLCVCVSKTKRIPESVCKREKQNLTRRFRAKRVEMANSKSSLAQAVCHRAAFLDRKGRTCAIFYALLIWLCQVPLQSHLSFWQIT